MEETKKKWDVCGFGVVEYLRVVWKWWKCRYRWFNLTTEDMEETKKKWDVWGFGVVEYLRVVWKWWKCRERWFNLTTEDMEETKKKWDVWACAADGCGFGAELELCAK